MKWLSLYFQDKTWKMSWFFICPLRSKSQAHVSCDLATHWCKWWLGFICVNQPIRSKATNIFPLRRVLTISVLLKERLILLTAGVVSDGVALLGGRANLRLGDTEATSSTRQKHNKKQNIVCFISIQLWTSSSWRLELLDRAEQTWLCCSTTSFFFTAAQLNKLQNINAMWGRPRTPTG